MTGVEKPECELLRCPFCGKDDIEYDLALCSGCHAEITYDTDMQSVTEHSPGFEEKFEADRREHAELCAKLGASNWFNEGSLLKKANALMEKIKHDAAVEDAKLLEQLEERAADPDRQRVVTFTRGDRSLDVHIGAKLIQ